MGKFTTHIRPPLGFSLGLRELWQYRELFYFFTWRDIKVKYKQTYLGILWALLQPLGMMVIFTFLFSKTWKIDTTPVSYPVFVLAGLICWNLFSASVSHAGESMIKNANIINKIYFPRLVIPCSSVLVALFDFVAGLLIFLVFCVIYKQPVHISALLYFPVGILVLLLSAFGAGTFLAALNVKYRDFRYTIPFLLQFLFFTAQVIYPLQLVQQSWLKYLLAVNPVNAAIELFRYPLQGTLDTAIVSIGLGSAVLIAAVGLFYFRKTEAYFADLT
ncbi:MAG TPA: ABC transporter permease [Chitinophagaceae bacterium]|jgi:lipopolysaccharide transport system permease protein|nr:ABC transporter permease [Chitinophagaceae bacterium]